LLVCCRAWSCRGVNACACLSAHACSPPASAHGKRFRARGGLFADEAVQLLQMFYKAGNPLGACLGV
jgi:hypothetical protein